MSTSYSYPTGHIRSPESAPRPPEDIFKLSTQRVHVAIALEHTLQLFVGTETTPHEVTVDQAPAGVVATASTTSTVSKNPLIPEQSFKGPNVDDLRKRVQMLSRSAVDVGEQYDQEAA